MTEERSFKPSKRKIEKARAQGRALKSSILTQFAALFAVVTVIWAKIGYIWVGSKMLLEYGVASAGSDLDGTVSFAGTFVFQVVTLVLGVCAGTAVVTEFAQIGVRVETKPLSPQFERLNPVSGLKRMVSGIQQLWRSLLRVGLVGFVGGLVLLWQLPRIAAVQTAQAGVMLQELGGSVVTLLCAVLGTMAVLSGFDYLLQRRSFYRELSMSHEEVREEQKEQEGSPLMRALRRALHERIAMQDLEKRVRRSKIIVVRKALS